MATLRIDIAGNPRTIPYKSFIEVATNSMAILDDLDHAFSGRQAGATEWYMNDLGRNGSLRVEVYSRIKSMRRKELPDVGRKVADSFVRGFGMLEHEGRSPEYLTSAGMNRAQKMMAVLGQDRARALIASTPESHSETEITEVSVRNLKDLLPEASKSLGSIEGMLETISTHRKRLMVVVYESMHGKAVTCEVLNADLLPKIKDSLDKRVSVTGIISRNAKSEPRKVIIERPEDFKVFGEDLKVLPFRRLGGSDPDFTGGLTTDEFIRNIRG